MPASPEWLLLGRTFGVEPTPMGMAEVYAALQTGAIEGQENPLTIMYAAKFFEVTEQVVLTSHLVQPVFFAIGKPAWDKMTDAQKKVVQGRRGKSGGPKQQRPRRQRETGRRYPQDQGAEDRDPGPRSVPRQRRKGLCRVRPRKALGRKTDGPGHEAVTARSRDANSASGRRSDCRVATVFATLAFAAVVAAFAYGVFARYALNNPSDVASELSIVFYLWAVMIGGSLAVSLDTISASSCWSTACRTCGTRGRSNRRGSRRRGPTLRPADNARLCALPVAGEDAVARTAAGQSLCLFRRFPGGHGGVAARARGHPRLRRLVKARRRPTLRAGAT